MNMSRLALAAVAAWIVDSIYGYCVYGQALMGEFASYPGVFRSMEAVNGKLPLMFAGSLLGFFALAYIFAKGHEGGNGLAEGLRFGVVLAIFEFGMISIGNYAVMNIGRKLAVEMAIAGFVEGVLSGVVLGLVYRPAASRTVRV
jgi:hypothetical protein